MKLHFSLLSIAALVLLPGSFVHADGVEQIAPTAADVAKELGISLSKFSAKFKEPVYALFEVKILVEGEKDVIILSQSTPEPAKFHAFSLSVKDMDLLSRTLGIHKASEAKGAWDIALKHPQVGFTQRSKNPFHKLKVGQSFLNWTNPQSEENPALGKAIPLVIQAGPFTEDAAQPKNLVKDYEQSPAFIWFGVTFSKEKPIEEPEAEPAPKK